MSKIFKNLMRTTFLIDFLITFGFGLAAWLSPKGTFGTIISIPPQSETLILSVLSSLSIFYILIGLVCLIGFKASFPINIWIGAVMILRHGWIGTIGILGLDNEKEWLIGNPLPDIVIHSIFVFAYIIGIYII
ncbi:MAG: hypothetical protein PF484_15140 [Bacteroidales bacterium]|jgi:hypothetical protein|nr:hypothetical protein [Bacteroidales bacterium]